MPSSTTASGHIGTGVGTHAPSWAHYKAPLATDTRVTHTYYVYADANQKILAASASSGSLTVDAYVYRKSTKWFCGNGACPATNTGASLPSFSGCTIAGSGRHSWVKRNTWTAGAKTTATLYYNKSGSTTQVSYHSVP